MGIFKAILRGVALLFALLLILCVFLLTPTGFKTALKLAANMVPGTLSYGHASGLLTSPIDIDDLDYQHDGQHIHIKKIHLKWQLTRLLLGKLAIKDLQISDVHITSPEQTTTNTSNTSNKKTATHRSPLQLPLTLNIERLDIHHVYVGTVAKKYPYHFERLSIQGTLKKQLFNLQAISILEKPYPLKMQLNITGRLSHYKIRLEARNHHFHGIITGTGDQHQIHIKTQENDTLGGRVKAQLKLHWFPVLQWQAQLSATQLHLKKLNPALPKKISIQLKTQGELPNHAKMTLPHFSLDTVITTPDARIKIQVSHQQQWQAQWAIHIQQLANLFPHSGGSIQSSGSIRGASHQLTIRGNLTAKALSYNHDRIGRINSHWSIDPSNQQKSQITLNAHNLFLQGHQIDQLTFHSIGKLTQQQTTLNIKNADTHLHLSLQGGWQQQQWQGKIQTFNIRSKLFNHWRLPQPVHLNMGQHTALLQSLCLKSNDSEQLCLQGFLKNHHWQAKLNAQHMQGNLLSHLLNANLRLSSRWHLQTVIAGDQHGLQQFKTDFKLSPGTLLYNNGTHPLHSKIRGASLTSQLSYSKTITTQISLGFHQQDHIKATINLRPDQSISGQVNTVIDNLNAVKVLTGNDVIAQGQISSQLQLTGTLKKPRIHGAFKLSNGSIQIPNIGLNFKRINLNIQADQQAMRFQLHANSAGQAFTLSGNTNIDRPGFPTEATLKGTRILAMNASGYTVYISPNLTAKLVGKHLTVNGSITIPKALIAPTTLASGGTTLPGDAVIIGGTAKKDKPWKISGQVAISLGKDVRLKIKGVSANLSGNITISTQYQQPYLANGRINIQQGKIKTPAVSLNIDDTSALTFTHSPLDDPLLDVRIYRAINVVNSGNNSFQQFDARQLIVGLQLRGSANHLQMSLYSTPTTLSQSDILSYLLLGSAGGSGIGGAGLAMQALSITNLGGLGGLMKSGGIISELKKGLGFTELGVESGTTLDAIGNPISQQSSFVVGKYLSPRLYLRYSMGLIIPVNIVQLRYDLKKGWMIQTDHSTLGTGIDVLYTIQKN